MSRNSDLSALYGISKAWGWIAVTGGTPSATNSLNVSSVTDTGVGIATVNYTNSMATSNYAAAQVT